MRVISDLYYRTVNRYFYKPNERYIESETEGFGDYMTRLQKENKDLKHRNLNLEKAFNDICSQNDKLESDNDYLVLENSMLAKKCNELDSSCDKLTQENGCMDKHIKELETDLKDYYKIQDKQQEQLEDYMLYGEDNPYYIAKYSPKLYEEILKNKNLEDENMYLKNYNKMLENANFNLKLSKDILEIKLEEFTGREEIKEILKTDKTPNKKDISKEVINVMCDKFNIDHEEVFKIIDDIQSNSNQQRERKID